MDLKHVRLTRRGFVLAGSMLVAGCGFRPLYGTVDGGRGADVQDRLASIVVANIPERPGQLLRQALQARLGGAAGAATPRYILTVSFGISGEGIGVLSDSTTSRTRVIGTATWSLRHQAPSDALVVSGTARSSESFNNLNNQYFFGDLQNEDSQRRLALAIADQITTQLAAYFTHAARAG